MAHHCGSYTRSHYYQADLEKTKKNNASNNNSVYADAVFADPALRNEGEPKSGSSETRPQSHRRTENADTNAVYADAVFADPALRNEGEPNSGSSEKRPQSNRRTQNAGPVMVDPIYANPALNNEGEPNSGSSEKREKPQRAKAGAASEDAARQTMIREDELNTPVTPVNRNTSTPQPKTPATQNCPHPCCLRHCPRPCCQDGEVTTARDGREIRKEVKEVSEERKVIRRTTTVTPTGHHHHRHPVTNAQPTPVRSGGGRNATPPPRHTPHQHHRTPPPPRKSSSTTPPQPRKSSSTTPPQPRKSSSTTPPVQRRGASTTPQAQRRGGSTPPPQRRTGRTPPPGSAERRRPQSAQRRGSKERSSAPPAKQASNAPLREEYVGLDPARSAGSTGSRGSSKARTPTPMRRCQCPYHCHSTEKKSPKFDVPSAYVAPDLRNEGQPKPASKETPKQHTCKHTRTGPHRHRAHRKGRRTPGVSDESRTPSRQTETPKRRDEEEKAETAKPIPPRTAHKGPQEEEYVDIPKNRASHIVVSHGETMNECFPKWTGLAYQNGHYTPYDLNMPAVIPRRPVEHFRYDPPLTEHGSLTAEFIGHAFKLAFYNPKVIYSSPELRCVQTSAAISRAYGNSVQICLEPALADWVQLTPQSSSQNWLSPEEYKALGYPILTDYKPHLYDVPKAESPEDYLRRLGDFFRSVQRPVPEKVIVIVANANALELARNHYWQTPGQIGEMKRNVRNCGVCEIRVDREKKVHVIEPNLLPFTKTLKEARGKIAT